MFCYIKENFLFLSNYLYFNQRVLNCVVKFSKLKLLTESIKTIYTLNCFSFKLKQ